MQQIYGRTSIPEGGFNNVALQICSPVNLLHIFRTLIYKNLRSGGLFLSLQK